MRIDLVVAALLSLVVLCPCRTQAAPPRKAASSPWPEGIVFLGDDCSLYRPRERTNTAADSLTVTLFTARRSRAFPEHDLPIPVKLGRKLYALRPARPEGRLSLLWDAEQGAIGSPSVTYDGRHVLFSMAREGDAFFHIYRIPAEGGSPQQLTRGPFHDIDPVELPDGRIAFVSTRIGKFDEYHSAPSRALFVMTAEGTELRPLTHTIIFDNEPEVLADGRILMIRSDNFFDRAKVETRLHVIRTDGTGGETAFGIDRSPGYGSRLRAFYCGSPAPMSDGRVAFVSASGVIIGYPGTGEFEWQRVPLPIGDVAALPDNRLVCTLDANAVRGEAAKPGTLRPETAGYDRIVLIDPDEKPLKPRTVFESRNGPIHSPVFLGPRPRPPVLPSRVSRDAENDVEATGFLFCQNVKRTRNTRAGWSHIRAVRVLAAKAITYRSSHSYIVHAGSEVVELGTVPVAADGSFHIEVPADTPLALQLVDAEGRSELNEMSWIYVRPGERRSCTGCHDSPRTAPELPGQAALALRIPPLKLVGRGEPHRYRGNNAAVTGLMELQFDRFREVAGLNRHDDVRRLAGREEGRSDIETLLDQLSRGDSDARVSAAYRLGLFRDAAASLPLTRALRDDVREVRVAAAVSLAACGRRDAIEPLLHALRDADPWVAQGAAMALENLTGHRVSRNLFASRNDRVAASREWQMWWKRHSWNAVERQLVSQLDSRDRDAVRRAAVALGHIGADQARAALRAYVGAHRRENPYPAWRAQGHRGDAARFDARSPANPRTLQAAVRSLGYLRDAASIDLLEAILRENLDPEQANLFLAEAAAEALGRIGTPRALSVLVRLFAELRPYPQYTRWYGDHEALMACHVSPIHYYMVESLAEHRAAQSVTIVPHLIRSLPIDPDRALMLELDDYETLVGRLIRQCGAERKVVETCLALLGDPRAEPDPSVRKAIQSTHRCWAGDPTASIRAAQILSIVAVDAADEPRIRSAFEQYARKEVTIPRVFQTGIPVVERLPEKNWICFYLARSLAALGRRESLPTLLAALRSPPEAATGRPDPLDVGVLFLHNGLTPCWRAAAAWGVGRIGDPASAPALLEVVRNLDNAPDVRFAAASALRHVVRADQFPLIREVAESEAEWSIRRQLMRIVRD